MIEWAKLTSDEVNSVDHGLPVIIPLGLIEAHGHHLSLGLDNDTAEFFSRRVAEASGAILAPVLNYGFADAMREYPGTIGVSVETLSLVVRDVALMFYQQGFHKQIYFSGHGANKLGCELGFYKAWEHCPQLKPVYWNWWSEAGFTQIHHADKGETEIALAIGSIVHMQRAQDYSFKKPWHMVHSRYQYQPETGGTNGFPTQAQLGDGERMRDEIIATLSGKVREIIADQDG
jgi:creatinine amidohydrolase